MSNRWIRFLLAVIAIAAGAGAAYRVVQYEQRLAADHIATRAAEFTAESALSTVQELNAALHAYVAPGQGHAFWTARAALLLDKLRSTLLELDATATASGASLAESLDTSDRLAATEQRARDHVRSGQALLAGDVIFVEARDLIDGLRIQIGRARDQIATASGRRETDVRTQQVWLLAGAAGVLVFVVLLLVPGGRAAQPDSAPAAAEHGTAPEDVETLVRRAQPVAPARAESQASSPPSLSRNSAGVGMAGGDTPPTEPALDEPVHVGVSAQLAALCHDIAEVTDSTVIESLLGRAAKILDARGVIIWMSTRDRNELTPVAAWGYDERVLARLGSIQSGSDNLTAAAFRENTHRAASPAGTAAAALAIPLPSPEGPAGVFSAELEPGIHVDDGRLSVARVIAAQLGALLGTIPSAPPQHDAQQAQQR